MSQRPQVRPATEGWKQKLDEKTGKPLLQFAEVKRGKPPVHLVDLTPEERAEGTWRSCLPSQADRRPLLLALHE
jgi:hypothetical protein